MCRGRFVFSSLFAWSFVGAALAAAGGAREMPADLREAWDSYRRGDGREAQRLARAILEARPADADARRLSVLSAYVTGNYELALVEYEQLGTGAGARKELGALVVEALKHLNRLDQAADRARGAGLSAPEVRFLEERARRPLSVALAGTTVVPFAAGDFLGDLMPAVEVRINGQVRVAHLDTGGAHIAMAPSTAQALGIPLAELGTGRASTKKTSVSAGIAGSLAIGAAELRNVPVSALGVLETPGDPRLQGQIILGTNVLEQFLVTWDNGRRRLILSPRGDARQREAHFALIPKPTAEVAFLLQGDHFMLARGGAGARSDLVFFVDTGLVTLDHKGRQPALGVTPDVAKAWGLDFAAPAKLFADAPDPIALGPLSQPGHGAMLLNFGQGIDWHGIEVAALLGHGFTRRYIWTLDFDAHEWFFSEIAPMPAPTVGDVAGRYEVAPGIAFEVTVEGGAAFLQAPGQKRVPLQSAEDGAFVIPGADAKVTFVRDAAGAVTGLVLEQAGRQTRASRQR